jgi:hypothetical protein
MTSTPSGLRSSENHAIGPRIAGNSRLHPLSRTATTKSRHVEGTMVPPAGDE